MSHVDNELQMLTKTDDEAARDRGSLATSFFVRAPCLQPIIGNHAFDDSSLTKKRLARTQAPTLPAGIRRKACRHDLSAHICAMSSAIPVQPPGQPLSKAAPIAQLTIPAAAESDDEVPSKPVEGLRGKTPKAVKEPNHADPSSLPSTLALIQRILTPDRNAATQTDPAVIEDVLPPLTSSNDVDVELYAILAIIIKDFVNTWYTKITTDHGFVEEIIQIIAHCSRALEQRLRRVDAVALLLDEVPLLVQAHVEGKGQNF